MKSMCHSLFPIRNNRQTVRFTLKECSNIRDPRHFLLRIPFTDAKKLRLIVLVSTLKYLIWLAHKRGISDKSNVDTFIS